MTPAASSGCILAISSATRHASVALLRDDAPCCELWAAPGRQHAESLLPLVDEILRRSDCALDAITGYGLAIGPGSFTSLRVGLATLKGLAFGSVSRVAPISSLRTLAAATSGDGERPVIGMLDAMRDEVYAAAYAGESGGWEPRPEVLPERVYCVAELAERIPPNALLIGEGTRVVFAGLRAILGDGIEIAEDRAPTGTDPGAAPEFTFTTGNTPGEADLLVGPRHPSEPSAAIVGQLARAVLQAGEGVSASSLAPHYVRRAEAEVLRTRERFEAAPNPSSDRPATASVNPPSDPSSIATSIPTKGFDTTRKLS